jgi:hypothetical protein
MTSTDPPATPPADQDWFGGRRWTGIAAVGVLIVVAVCALVVFVLDHGGPARQAAPIAGRPATVPTVAGLPSAVPTAAPAGTSWVIYQTVALPSLPGAGPVHVDGAIATGYAHTPLGALLAAANESYRYGLAGDDQWLAAAQQMLAPGPGYDAWLSIRAAHPYGPAGGAGRDKLSQLAGFEFISYTPSDAVIQVVTRDVNGVLQVGAEHVTWQDGDWRFVLAPDGSQLANVQQAASLEGFVEWRGV